MDPSVLLDKPNSTRENVFSRSSTQRKEEDDEESLKWAALQKLPTYDRMRTAIMKTIDADGKTSQAEVDVRNLSYEDRQQIISKLLRVTEEDNERFLLKFRERIDRCDRNLALILSPSPTLPFSFAILSQISCEFMCFTKSPRSEYFRVGIVLPKIEVRFEHLNVEADVYVGSRALPTLPNFLLTLLETLLSKIHLSPSKKKRLNILHDVSGILKPSRFVGMLSNVTLKITFISDLTLIVH